MGDLFFADISNYQQIDVAAYRAKYGVLLCEINWGEAVTVPAGRIEALRAADFDLLVWYFGIRSDQPIASQVASLTETVGKLLPNEAILVDWEATPKVCATPPVAEREEARTLAAQGLDVPVAQIGTYGSASDLKDNPAESWSIVASYETPEPAIPHTAWQFTNGQYTSGPYGPVNWPGIGFCDASVYHGTTDELKAAIGLQGLTKPTYASLLLLTSNT